MFIQTETTPNPSTIKFLPGQTVLESGAVEFSAPDQSGPSPLAQRLFSLQGVKRILVAGEYIAVSKAEDTDWNVLKPMVLGVLMDHFSTGAPVLDPAYAPHEGLDKPDNGNEDDEISLQIRELIETRVRPMVAMDGGDIVFESFQGGIVTLQMRGACSGCPSATMTLKSGIEKMLRHYIPEVTEVRAAGENDWA